MVSEGTQFHKSIFAVCVIQCKSLPHKNWRWNDSKTDTEPLTNTGHIENDEKDKDGKQSAGKEKEILAFQAFKLHRLANAFVDWIVCHDLQEKGT